MSWYVHSYFQNPLYFNLSCLCNLWIQNMLMDHIIQVFCLSPYSSAGLLVPIQLASNASSWIPSLNLAIAMPLSPSSKLSLKLSFPSQTVWSFPWYFLNDWTAFSTLRCLQHLFFDVLHVIEIEATVMLS